MRHGPQVVNFMGSDIGYNVEQIRRIRKVSIMQKHFHARLKILLWA